MRCGSRAACDGPPSGRAALVWAGALLLTVAILVGCEPAPPASVALSGAAVARLLTGATAVAIPVQEASAVQELVGSAGGLGPTDHRYFGAAHLDEKVGAAFIARARPLSVRPAFERPVGEVAWWPGERRFQGLSFHEHPHPPSGMVGWVAWDAGSRTLYFCLSTT